MDSGAAPSPRSSAIDIIKGLAIVAVICLHTLSVETLHETAALFHLWQAVPVFIFIMGLNAAGSLGRRGGGSLRELYSRDYLTSRVDRIYVPFLVAFAATVLLALLTHNDHFGPRTILGGLLLGTLPINGPGNYFITLVFQFALVFPLLFWGLRRRPVGTLLVCLAIDVAFEAIAPHLAVIARHPYLYEVCLARYLFLVALGGLLAGSVPRLLGSRWFWGAALFSAAYLGLASLSPESIPLGERDWLGEGFASAFYTTLVVVLGMRLLPAAAQGWLARALAEIGRASYHIFLVQITWFGLVLWSSHSAPALLGNLAATLSVGLVFYRVMELRTSARTYRKRPAWRRTPRRASSGP